ncbi:MAG: glucosamine-6-phosphate deaminase [Planctomycetota bacterium]
MATSTAPRVQRLPAQYLRHTKIPTLMFRNSREAARHVATMVESLIRENNAAGKPTVLGLPTGSTPVGVYRELIRMHKEEGLDFSLVVTFNLDEYFPMPADSMHSYNCWMHANFFDHVNIAPGNIHIPRGDVAPDDMENWCAEYEEAIRQVGGIQLQLLGIGRTGHIAFNEPGSASNSRTRLVALDPVTRKDAAATFFGEDNVPVQAVTMGVGTILEARKIVIMALGDHKSKIVRKAVEGEITDEVTASYLQRHSNALFVLDDAASSELTAIKTPWLVGPVDWTPLLERKAVIWLARETKKPLLKLEKKDFIEHYLHDLVRNGRTADEQRERVFGGLLRGICTHPAGTEKRTVICFSPHPDDDVISMGGALIRMAEQGHDVHVAYMTSGNIAVFDHDALRHLDYVKQFNEVFGLQTPAGLALDKKIRDSLTAKQPGTPDIPELLEIKGLIRKTEATAAAICAGVPEERHHFLNLPFYKTGTVEKAPISEADANIISALLRELKPAQIYLAGDLSDPHGTHRMCASAIFLALREIKDEPWFPEVWMYRGAWQDYEPHEIERAVPLSPELITRKKLAIFKHESQKDAALFPGNDEREFWLRAEERTKNTACIYNLLGLPEYYAIEGFVQWRGQLV